MSKFCLAVLTLLASSLSHASGDMPVGLMRIQTAPMEVVNQAGEKGYQTLELIVGQPENEAELARMIEWFKTDLAFSVSNNLDLAPRIALLEEQEERSPQSIKSSLKTVAEKISNGLAAVTSIFIPKETQTWIRKNFVSQALNRKTLALVRGSINSSLTYWVLTESGLPHEIAIPAALVTGMMSGGLQWFNERIQKFLTTPYLLKAVLNMTPEQLEELTKKDASTLAPELKGRNTFLRLIAKTTEFPKWYGMEFVFASVITFSIQAAQHFLIHVDPKVGVPQTLATIGWKAFLTFGAQAGWDLAIARATGDAKLEALHARKPDLAANIQAKSNLKITLVSLASVSLLNALLMNIPIAETGVVIMGLSGWLYYAKANFGAKITSFFNPCKESIRGKDDFPNLPPPAAPSH